MELEPHVLPPARPGWLRRHVTGLVCSGLGLAALTATALVLGWTLALVLVVIAGLTLLAILILSEMM